MVDGTAGLGGPNVRARIGRAQGQKHEPVHHPDRLTAEKYVVGLARSQACVNRLLKKVSKIWYMHTYKLGRNI